MASAVGIKSVALWLLLFGLTACVSPNHYPQPELQLSAVVKPGVMLLVEPMKKTPTTICVPINNQPYWLHCASYADQTAKEVRERLEKLAVFDLNPEEGGEQPLPVLLVRLNKKFTESGGKQAGKLLLHALTAITLPMPYEVSYTLQVSLLQDGQPLFEKEYQRASTQYETWYNYKAYQASAVDSMLREVAKDLWPHVATENKEN